MNEHDLEALLVKALTEQDRAKHQAILDDSERLAEYRQYSWWSEEFTPSRDEYDEYSGSVNWGEFHYGFNKVVVDDTIVEVVDTEGGTEGGGEHTHLVVKLTLPDGTTEYWKKLGYYASHYGTDWDGELFSVTPVERTVVFYE